MTYLSHSSPFCNICDSDNLIPLMHIAKTGVPHSSPGHKYTCDSTVLLVCQECQHGQVVKYSHDCWAYHGDEDWDMYWYYDLQPADMKRLETLLAECPHPLDADCSCGVHAAMKTAWELTSTYKANVKMSAQKVPYVRVSLEIQGNSSMSAMKVIPVDN